MVSEIQSVIFKVLVLDKLVEIELTPQAAYEQLTRIFGAPEVATPEAATPEAVEVPVVVEETPAPCCDTPCKVCAPPEEGDCLTSAMETETESPTLSTYIRDRRKSMSSFFVPADRIESLCPAGMVSESVSALNIRNVFLYAHKVSSAPVPVYVITETSHVPTVMHALSEMEFSELNIARIQQKLNTQSGNSIRGTLEDLIPVLLPNTSPERLLGYLVCLHVRGIILLSYANGIYSVVKW